jgi:type 1 glutamine amidotransferase
MKKVFLLASLALALSVLAAENKYVPKPEDVKKVKEIVRGTFLEKPLAERKVLVFYKTEGYCHRDSIALGNATFKIVSEKTKAFSVDLTEDYTVFKKENLSKYDAVVLLNTTSMKVKVHDYIVPNLTSFVKEGKGLTVIHAGADNFFDSEVASAMVGGCFCGHPWNANRWWAFNNEEPNHPVSACFGKKFLANDEIYVHTSPPFDRSKLHVLISLDLTDDVTREQTKKKLPKVWKLREDNDYAVSWVRPYGKGRVFYTSFGHDTHAWLDPAVLKHIMNGLQYTLGDLKADDSVKEPLFP